MSVARVARQAGNFNLMGWFSLTALLSVATVSALAAWALSAFLTERMIRQHAGLTAGFEGSIARAERVEKPQKPEKRGPLESAIQVAREATETPRGANNERPGDRQNRGGRKA